MKIKIEKQILESILISLQPFLEKKDATQITSHILFQTENGKCVIKATDSEIGLKIVTNQIITEEEGSFTTHGKKLLNIIKILKNDEIILELIKDNIFIKQKYSKFKLPTFNPKAYPSFPSIDNQPQISLDSLTLIKNLKKISSAIDTFNPKPELHGALINITKDFTDLVATDTRRLAISKIEGENNQELSLIIPKKAISEIQKLFLNQIDIYFDQDHIIISNQNYFFYTRLINGNYPDYQRIIPKTIKHSISLPKKEMLESIKMITTISQEIKIDISSDSIIFHSLSSDNVEAKTKLEINTLIKEDLELSFNSKFILDFLSQIDEDNFILELNEPSLPFVVKNKNFMTIIMPIVR